MSNAFTVWNKANPMAPVSEEEMNAAVARGIRQAQEVNARNDAKRADANWRVELDELNARLAGRPTPDAAQEALDGLKASIAETVKRYKADIASCREALKEQFLSNAERSHVAQRIEVLSGELQDLLKQSETRLRFAEGSLRDAQAWEPKRARWTELKDRAAKVNAALKS